MNPKTHVSSQCHFEPKSSNVPSQEILNPKIHASSQCHSEPKSSNESSKGILNPKIHASSQCHSEPKSSNEFSKGIGCRSYGTTSDPFSIRRLGDFKRQKRPICGSYLAAKQNKQPQKASL